MNSNSLAMNARKLLSALTLAILFFSTVSIPLFAQYAGSSNAYNDHYQNKSVLFGNDIIINNQPIQDQKGVIVRSAFNGWLFAVYTYLSSGDEFPALTILKSTDNGLSWVVLSDFFLPFDDSEFRSVDFVVCGNTVSNLKIILAELIVQRNSANGEGIGYVLRVNGETGLYEDDLLTSFPCFSISLATDFMFPATNSNPYSIGCLISDIPFGIINSVTLHSSSNGGLSFDKHIEVAGTLNRFTKVALSYGRSLSGNTGRYFATWEEKTDFSAPVGHIYTAHSDPLFNSGFTTPVLIDSLVPGNYNMVRNPSIACQVNNSNNDSSDITEVIVFEKMSSIPGEYEIHGVFNKKAGLSDHYTPFIPNQTPGNNVNPSIIFNPFDSTFILTYFNAIDKKLCYFRKDFNMQNPSAWQEVSAGYNDSDNLTNPVPNVALNIGQKQGMVAWASEGTSGNGVALFDAPYLVTGVAPISMRENNSWFKLWPNPCKTDLNLSVELSTNTRLNVKLLTLVGAPVATLTDRTYQKSKYVLKYDLSSCKPGWYILEINTHNESGSSRVCIMN